MGFGLLLGIELHDCFFGGAMDNKTKWDRNMSALRDFVEENGHAKVPSTFVAGSGTDQINLGTWVAYMRTKYRKNSLGQDKIAELESMNGWVWNPGKPGPVGNPKRDAEIIKARQSGMNLQSIAEEFDLSRQRVHQIIERARTARV
jgi:Mor family transcriptional regulator